MRGSVYLCGQLLLMKNNKVKNRSQLRDGHKKMVMMVVSSNLLPRLKMLSQSKQSQVSSQCTW